MNDINLDDVPLSWLSNESRNLLSCLLNTTKVIASEGPEKLPRDWRGLASLVQISAQLATNIDSYQDKIGKVLEIWMNKFQDTAYVGNLRLFLQRLDRYDVWDDCIELHRQGQLIDIPNEKRRQIAVPIPDECSIITYDDQRFGQPQIYHAFVLYAEADKDFVDELLRRMKEENLKLCTLDDLLPGHATQYAPVSRLISDRCHRIILVYSPEFLRSPANTFYTDYAQAVGIEKQELKILPLMYRECMLPTYLSYYHKLYFNPPGQKSAYDFWQRLSVSLKTDNKPRLPSCGSNYSTLKITEVNSNSTVDTQECRVMTRNVNYNNNSMTLTNGYEKNKRTQQLQLPDLPSVKSVSLTGLDSHSFGQISLEDTKSQYSLNQLTKKQKKPSKVKVFLNNLTKKKNKKALKVDC